MLLQVFVSKIMAAFYIEAEIALLKILLKLINPSATINVELNGSEIYRIIFVKVHLSTFRASRDALKVER